MRKRTTTSAAALAALLWLAPTAPASAGDDVSIAIPALSLSFSVNYIAQDQGYWSKQGLDVKLANIAGVGATNAVLAGSVDFANASGPTGIRAPARGQKLVSVAETADKMLIELVMSKATADAEKIGASTDIKKKIQAMRGKKVAVETVNSIVHGFVRYVAKKGGLDPERDITVTTMQPPAMLAALKSGAIDAFAMSMPWPLVAEQQMGAVRIVSGPHGDLPEIEPFAYNVIVAKPETCEKRPTMCKRLIAGYAQAFTFMHDHPKESLAILAKQLPSMDPKILAEGFKVQVLATPKTPRVQEASLVKAQDFMVATGMLNASEKIVNLKDIYTNAYLGN